MTSIQLSQIQTNGLQARVSTDSGTVDEYAEAMKAGQVLPPMIVFSDGREYWLADGFHRLSALLKIGAETATVMVREGTREDAMWFAVAANKTHGLRRTNADKRKAVIKALELHPEMSDRAIAEHVGVDHKTVAICRPSTGEIPQFQPVANQGSDQKETPKTPKLRPPPPPPKRVGLDGKSRPLPPPPKVEKPAKAKEPVDSIGRVIPEGIRELWDVAASMRVYLSTISKLRGEIRRAQEDKSIVFAEVQLNFVHAELDNLYTHLGVTIPYAVCPTCQGQIPKGCRLCVERGYISEHRWKTAVPKETKQIILASIAQ